MARAAIGWTVDDLAAAAGLGRVTVLRFEQGETLRPANVLTLRRALQAKGIRFVDGGELAGGVIPPKD